MATKSRHEGYKTKDGSRPKRPKSLAALIVEGINETSTDAKDSMVDTRKLERRYVPIFCSLGMEDLIRKRLSLAKIKETRTEMMKGLKERVIQIPANIFEQKRKERLKVGSALIKDVHTVGSSAKQPAAKSLAWSRRRRQSYLPAEAIVNRVVAAHERENIKDIFEIRYKDMIVPDQIFYSEAFQKVKKESILLSMNQAVHRFFRNKEDKTNRDLVCSWLSSLDEMVEISLSLMKILMDFFTLKKFSHEYSSKSLPSLPSWR